MENKYGSFAPCVDKLDEAQRQVNGVWHDSVGDTYNTLNENIKSALHRIWSSFQNCSDGVSAVKTNYHPEEIDRDITLLARKVEDA